MPAMAVFVCLAAAGRIGFRQQHGTSNNVFNALVDSVVEFI